MTRPQGHLDLDALADVLAGEADDSHLRSCAACADALAELAAAEASVTAALHELPPPPLPEDLSLRLTRALHEERRREVATARPHRRRPPVWLPGAAAAVALFLAGAVGWSLLDPSLQGSSDDSSAASGGGGESSADTDSGAALDSGDTASAPEAAAEQAAPPAAATPTDWAQETSRPTALARLLVLADAEERGGPPASAGTALAAPAPSAAADLRSDALDRLRDPAELAACLAGLPTGDDEVLAVDYARYAGAPAVAVVQPADTGSVEVTVVGSTCSATGPAVLDRVVLPRP